MARKQIWTKAAVVKEIKRLARNKTRLGSKFMQTWRPDLSAAAWKYCGSWRKAVEAAGIDYESVREGRKNYWNKEKILAQIQYLKLCDARLSQKIVMRERRDLFGAACKYFGSWRKTLQGAGIDPASADLRRTQNWTQEKVVQEIKKRFREGLPLNDSSLRSRRSDLLNAGKKFFGNWRSAIKAAGFDYLSIVKAKISYWNRRRVLAEIRRLERLGIRLSGKSIRQLRGNDLFAAACRHFGDWGSAVEAAGFDYRFHWSYKKWLRRLGKDELKEIRRRAKVFAAKRRKSE